MSLQQASLINSANGENVQLLLFFFLELDEEEKALHEEEQIYWRDYCEHHKALLDFDDNHERLLFKFLLGY